MPSVGARSGRTRPVVVVTGGGAGIGAAIAEELGRNGTHVVTLDPLVTLDGTEALPPSEETTAGRIVAAGGSAQASAASVTDGAAVRALFTSLVDEHGALDAVINVAGITRPTSFARGREEDWQRVVGVHLGGYLTVLGAALPIMAAAGRGRILGVTSGSGWRAADTGAYGSAKRAVAALTWQLGVHAPHGVTVNAISPIAATRMVTEALARAQKAAAAGKGSAATGGLSLGSMPAPEDLGPFGAALVGDGFAWCQGRVLFAGGAEVAVVDEPRLLEVVRTDDVASVAQVLESVVPGALASAEAAQASNGGGNPRFGSVFERAGGVELGAPAVTSCAVITDRPEMAASVGAALSARGVAYRVVPVDDGGAGFEATGAQLASIVEREGPVDGIVVALTGGPAVPGEASGWERVLREHDGVEAGLLADASWCRAVADHAAATGRAVRMVTLTDACTAGGRSRAQASAQLARAGRSATEDRVVPFAVALEATGAEVRRVAGELAAHLLCHAGAPAVSGAELVVAAGWIGVRSHPRPGGSVVFGGPAVPGWLDGALREIAAGSGPIPEEHP